MSAKTARILLVDDEQKFLDSISRRLELMGYDSLKASSGKEALRMAAERPVDLAIVDLKMPDMDGLVTIAKLREIHPAMRSILLTGFGSEKVKQATEALDAEYFQKDEMGDFWRFIRSCHKEGNTIVIRPPGSNTAGAEISSGEERVLSAGNVEIIDDRSYPEYSTEANRHSGPQTRTPGQVRMIGETLPMQKMRRDINRFASLDCSVVIYGETGVGKELAARTLHELSPRCGQRFMAINCGCFSNDLLIEELFAGNGKTIAESGTGREKRGRKGQGGSLLLDQIEDLSPSMQLALLKVIDSNKTTRYAATGASQLDLRIFAASRHDLSLLVREGRFREELYYRLNVVELTIPPLRERRDDIPPLCRYFLERYAREFNKPVRRVADEVISIFMAYDFPGNVRELEHVIERAVILSEGDCLQADHLPERFKTAAAVKKATEDNYMTLAEREKQYILEVLQAADGNKSRTAELLGISRAALWRKLKLFQQDP
jgi:DNA-binding NtrC family response regulator